MPIKIVVTGPESTGKTTLCVQLSGRYKGTMIPEFSREYLKKTKGTYHLEDIENIGLMQSSLNNEAGIDKKISICDTDALTSYIWANEKYKVNSPALELAFKENLPDLYLLCYPDLKWEFDVLRESSGDLERIFNRYLEEIVRIKAPYAIISGIGRSRTNKAFYFIDSRFPHLISFTV